MSTATQAERLQAASEQVAINVYAPAFFDKLAEQGINPQNEAERNQLLELAVLLRENEWTPPAPKTASAKPNGFLNHCLGELRGTLQRQPAALKTAAANLARQNPALKAAALELAAAAGKM